MELSKERKLAIRIIEEVEEHVSKHENPFDEKPWYEIEDKAAMIMEMK